MKRWLVYEVSSLNADAFKPSSGVEVSSVSALTAFVLRFSNSSLAAPSCADAKPKHAFMVCLEHAELVCDECRLAQCTLYYSHELEDLEAIRDAVAARMASYSTWLRTFTPFFLPEANSAAASVSSSAVAAAPTVAAKVTLEAFEVCWPRRAG